MALDDVVKTTITGPRIEEAMYRTLRWIDRCIAGMQYAQVYCMTYFMHMLILFCDLSKQCNFFVFHVLQGKEPLKKLQTQR